MKTPRILIGFIAASAALAAAPAFAQTEFCPDLTNMDLVAPGPETLEGAQSHVYKTVDGKDLRLHVFHPEGGSNGGAAIVMVSSGGWMFGRVTTFLPQAEALVARGMTVIVPDVRSHCRDGVNIVDEVEDAKSAMRWARTHAAELGIDPVRIAASGGSAGGHLALSTAMFPQVDAADEDRSISSRPDLLVLFFPCVDPTSEVEQEFSASAIGDRGAEVSPLLHVEAGLPPLIIFQGTEDPLYEDINAFCARAREVGNACDYVEYEGAEHGFFRPGNQWYEAALAGMDEYLVRAGYLAPAS